MSTIDRTQNDASRIPVHHEPRESSSTARNEPTLSTQPPSSPQLGMLSELARNGRVPLRATAGLQPSRAQLPDRALSGPASPAMRIGTTPAPAGHSSLRQQVTRETVLATQKAIKSAENFMSLLPGHDHRLIIASSEGGSKHTTDQDDPEAIRRAVQLIRNLPSSEQQKITFVAYVNTNREIPNTTTRDGANDLIDYLVAAGIDRKSIHTCLETDSSTGTYKPGIHVVYGDDPGGKTPSVGVEGSFNPKTDLHINDKTEVSVLMGASPSGLSDVPVHNVSLVGNGRNATNDSYGAPGESQGILKSQEAAVRKYFEGRGMKGNELDTAVKQYLATRQIVYDFEAAFSDSLSGAKRKELFGPGSGLDEESVDKIKKATGEKIAQNEKHTLGLVNAASPDGAYGNRTFKAAKQILGIDEDDFKSGLSSTRKNLAKEGHFQSSLPDFLYATELPALAEYVHEKARNGSAHINAQEVEATLSQAVGADFGKSAADRREKLLAYMSRPEIMGQKFTANFAQHFSTAQQHISTDELAAAVAIHLQGVKTQMNLLFPQINGGKIPATEDAFEETVNANGGWESSKIPDYDTLAMSKLLFPKLDPANVMCAIDMPHPV